jgi:hypothetical protein
VLAGKLDKTLMRDHEGAAKAADYHDLYREMSSRASRELQNPGLALASREKK